MAHGLTDGAREDHTGRRVDRVVRALAAGSRELCRPPHDKGVDRRHHAVPRRRHFGRGETVELARPPAPALQQTPALEQGGGRAVVQGRRCPRPSLFLGQTEVGER